MGTSTCVAAHQDLMRSISTLVEEEGSKEDYERVGRFVGDLLKSRNYRWVSHQDAVLDVVDSLLPRLRTRGHEHYEDIQKLTQVAQRVQRDFGKLGDRVM